MFYFIAFFMFIGAINYVILDIILFFILYFNKCKVIIVNKENLEYIKLTAKKLKSITNKKMEDEKYRKQVNIKIKKISKVLIDLD